MAKPIDMTGQTIGKWHIDSLAYVKGYDKYYNCTCECGTKKVVLGQNIRSGKSRSCGCEKIGKHAPNFKDRTGEKYNKLTCIEYEKRGVYIYWKCKCECGNETWVRSENLATGAVKSCGCAQNGVNKVHGMSHTNIHNRWSRMHYRCENPKCEHYADYGGRGIKVCPEWCGTEGFIRFMEWSYANGFREELTIDRIDYDKDYSPDNCRWITQREQTLNTRRNVRFVVNGEDLTLVELCEKYSVPYKRAYCRLRIGWSIEEALEIKKHYSKRKRGKDGRFCTE